jgi:hypothetical protein
VRPQLTPGGAGRWAWPGAPAALVHRRVRLCFDPVGRPYRHVEALRALHPAELDAAATTGTLHLLRAAGDPRDGTALLAGAARDAHETLEVLAATADGRRRLGLLAVEVRRRFAPAAAAAYALAEAETLVPSTAAGWPPISDAERTALRFLRSRPPTPGDRAAPVASLPLSAVAAPPQLFPALIPSSGAQAPLSAAYLPLGSQIWQISGFARPPPLHELARSVQPQLPPTHERMPWDSQPAPGRPSTGAAAWGWWTPPPLQHHNAPCPGGAAELRPGSGC